MKQRWLLLPALALYGFLSYGLYAWLLSTQGLAAFWQRLTADWLLMVTVVDTCVFALIVLCWLWTDATRRQWACWRRVLLVLATLVFGSVVPLLYLAFRRRAA